jgi:glycosyltransferase involved in cell wall biosynthesis/GT2 family glycosyltransferase
MRPDVVIVGHESSAYIARAIGELPAVANVVVVDNASTDETAAIATSASVRVVVNEVNAGFGAAANQGATFGAGDAILFLNPDATIGASELMSLVARLEQHPDLAVISPGVRYEDGGEQRVAWPFPSSRAAWREAVGLHRVRQVDDRPGFVIGACFLVRRAAFEELGGFDARYWLYGEETDLCRRAINAGWKVELADDVWALHAGGASATTARGVVAEHFERGGERFVDDNEGRVALVSYRIANLVGATIRAHAPGSEERRNLHRARMRRYARVLVSSPATVRLDSPATTAPGHSLVVCSLEAWDHVWRRNQFLVRELLAADPHLRVLFVEPPFDWIHEVRRRPRTRPRRRGVRPVYGSGRVVALEPNKLMPRLLGSFADHSLWRQVRAATERLGFDAPMLWINDAAFAGLVATGWPTTYDITDDWLLASGSSRERRRLEADEARLLDRAAAVTVCSEALAESRRSARQDLTIIPNAVDLEHFTRLRGRPRDLPASPVAVYVGTLHEDRLDLDLLIGLAAAMSSTNFVLVGPNALSDGSTARLLASTNIHLLGSRDYADVPAYLQHADVIIVPHVVSRFTESLDPIKAYECAAVGTPTVATQVAGFRELGPPVRAVAREDFIDAVAGAIDLPATSASQVPATWSDRARSFREVLDRARGGGRQHRELRIAFVDHCAQLSGGELALSRLIQAMPDVGIRVILGEHGPLEEKLRSSGASVEVLELDGAMRNTRRSEVRFGRLQLRKVEAAVRDIATLRKRLREIDVDLVHTNSLKAAVYGGIAARLAGVPVVWHIRDRIASDYLPTEATVIVRLLGRWIPNAVVFNSQETRRASKIKGSSTVIPSPVIYDGVERVETTARMAPGKMIRVAMVGRLAPWKGQDVFLRAFAEAFPIGGAEAVVAGSAMFGEDDYAVSLIKLADHLGIGDRVSFSGFVDDVPRLLQDVDLLVHASVIPEPFGQVVVEGMAAGLPVIAAAAGGPAEIIENGINGVLTEPGDVAALSEALQRLANNPADCARLGSAARRRAQDFSPDVIADRVRTVWESVLNAPAERRTRR